MPVIVGPGSVDWIKEENIKIMSLKMMTLTVQISTVVLHRYLKETRLRLSSYPQPQKKEEYDTILLITC